MNVVGYGRLQGFAGGAGQIRSPGCVKCCCRRDQGLEGASSKRSLPGPH